MFLEQIRAFAPATEQEREEKRMILEYIRLFPDTVLTRNNEIAHITSSGLILNPQRTKVLLIYHNIYQRWAWTGGHADGETDLLQIALREAREETGLQNPRPLCTDMISLDILPVFGHVKNGKYVCCHQHLSADYLLIADEDEALAVKPDENSGVRWFDVDELDSCVNEPYCLAIYKKMIARARKI